MINFETVKQAVLNATRPETERENPERNGQPRHRRDKTWV